MCRVADRIRRLWLLSLAFAAALSGCDLGDDPEREPAGAETRNGGQRDPATAGAAEPGPLVERLRRGGYVLAFRHTATDMSMTDRGGDLRDCSRQRNLNAEGRRQARSIGRAFRAHTAQAAGELGRLNPRTGRSRRVALGTGSAPHGVIVGPDGAAWVTDGGLNAIVRVDQRSLRVRRFPLPRNRANANLNTATFDHRGLLWFTGQAGIYGQLNPRTGRMRVFDAPRGPGAYGIATTPRGGVWYASLAGSHVAHISTGSGRARVVEPPTGGQGARRIWSDSRGRLWVSEWNVGKLAMYDTGRRRWREWALPGDDPQPYAVYVDEADLVWVTDFGANALVRFDPATERFQTFRLHSPGASVRQLLGREGELWGAESGADRLVVARWR